MKLFSFWNWFVKSEIGYVQYEVEKHFFLIKIWTKLHIIFFLHTSQFPFIENISKIISRLEWKCFYITNYMIFFGETDPFLSVMRWFMRAINFYFTAEFLQWLSSSLQFGFLWFILLISLSCRYEMLFFFEHKYLSMHSFDRKRIIRFFALIIFNNVYVDSWYKLIKSVYALSFIYNRSGEIFSDVACCCPDKYNKRCYILI